MNFNDAIMTVLEGKRVGKADWGENDYMYLVEDRLSIMIDGKSHDLIIRMSDMTGEDYFVYDL